MVSFHMRCSRVSDAPGSCPKSELKINGTKVTITMPVRSPGADAITSEQEHLHCAQLLFSHVPSSFEWTLKVTAPAPCVVTTIKQELLQKLPLLESFVADFQTLTMDSSTGVLYLAPSLFQQQ
jgi:hypothetical protein